MLGIIAHHFVVNSAVRQSTLDGNPVKAASLYALVLGGWGKAGINVFLLITGYYACKSAPKLKNYLKLALEIAFYVALGFIIFSATGYCAYSLKDTVKTFIPFYGLGMEFTPTYLVFWLFIPFINLLVRNLNQKAHSSLALLLLFTDAVFQTLLRLPDAFTYMGWFFTVYVIAAYIRMCRDGDYKTKAGMFADLRKSASFMLISVALSVASIVFGAFVYKMFGLNIIWHFVADSNKLLSIAAASGVFLVFINSHMEYSKWINLVGGSTFGVLCIHANCDGMRLWLWGDVIDSQGQYELGLSHPVMFAFSSLISVAAVFAACTVIDLIRRRWIERYYMKWVEDFIAKRSLDNMDRLYGIEESGALRK